MADQGMIVVDVVHASGGGSIRRTITLAQGSTVMQAIDASGIARELPFGTVDTHRLGIYGRKVTPHHLLDDGDRIEIYRALLFDPKEARRRRAG
jgi:uncharacterized protein